MRVEREVGHEPFQPRVLILERPELAQFADARCAYYFFQMSKVASPTLSSHLKGPEVCSSTRDLGTLGNAEIVEKRAALRLDHEIEPFSLVGIEQDGPVRVVVAERRLDLEPAGQLGVHLGRVVLFELVGKARGTRAMLIKFIARGTGSASAAAGYLTRETDSQGEERADVTVLRGDPDQVAAVAGALEFEQKYTSAVIAWAPEDQPSDREIDRVLDEFEDTAWPGLAADRYAWTAVRHGEAGSGVHVHVVAARCDLQTGKSLNIAPPRLGADVWPAGGSLQRRARLEPSGRSGACAGAAAGTSRLHRGGGAAGRDQA